jgi:Winged helix domain, variant/ATPase family associated with various cellular activities (AAA)
MTTLAGDDVRVSAPPIAACLGLALERLEAILRPALAQAGVAIGAPADDPFRGLHLGPDTVGRILARGPGAPPFILPPAEEAELPDAVPAGSRLESIATTFGLSAFDVDVLLIALGPELDLRYERLYAYLHDDVTRKRPTVSLALDLLCRTADDRLARRRHFLPSAPLLRDRLIRWLPDPQQASPSLLATPFALDGQIVRFLLDEGGLDPRLASFCRLVTSPASFDGIGPDEDAARRLRQLVQSALESREPLALCFHGPDEDARLGAAHVTAAAAGCNLLAVDLAGESELDALLTILIREAHLQNAVLLLEGWEALRDSGPAATYRRLHATVAGHPGIVIFSGYARWTPAAFGPQGVVSIAFNKPEFSIRRTGWIEALALTGATVDPALADALAGRFRLGIRQIWDAVLTARRLAQSRHLDGAGPAAPQPPDFFAAARAQSGQDLAALANKIEPLATWNDIVLPDDAIAQLRELCARVTLGERVLNEWGFRRCLSHGKGVTALFSGPSGTGKTMAAEVIANELGMELYRIDLSAVVSKWIGETEKNLDRLFRLADNAVLFFDEADALFGKRSEVRDAHDRYANVEISYLLQKMESYEGLAILATNVRHHMDEAFLRRLTFVVQFPFPDDEQRRRIWEGIWPGDTPLAADLDRDHLSTAFSFSGGNVKNVALAAAFRAAERGAPVDMTDVLHAVRREYQKLGKHLLESTFARSDVDAPPVGGRL